MGEGSFHQGGGPARRGRPGLLGRRRRGGPLSRDARQSLGHAAARLLPRRVHRQPPHLPLRQAVDLADRRHQHGRRRRPVGARLALGGDGEVSLRHAGDDHRSLPGCRRRLLPDAPAGRAGHLPGAHQLPPQGGGRGVGGHRQRLRAEREDQRPAGGARRGRSLRPARQREGRCRHCPLPGGCRRPDAAGADARDRPLLLGRDAAGDRGQAEEVEQRVRPEAARRAR